MATISDIRSGLIDKILAIKNKELLQALDQLIATTSSVSNIIETTSEQKRILEMSGEDIKNGELISQEEMIKRNLEWLNEL